MSGETRNSFKPLSITCSEVGPVYSSRRIVGLPLKSVNNNNNFNPLLHRSNTSLDLEPSDLGSNLKREFGSAFSINALNSVNDIHETGSDYLSFIQRTKNGRISEANKSGFGKLGQYFKCKSADEAWKQDVNDGSQTYGEVDRSVTINSATLNEKYNVIETNNIPSPRFRNKFSKLLDMSKPEKFGKAKSKSEEERSQSSMFRKFKSSKSSSLPEETNRNASSLIRFTDPETRLEEKLRKKVFAHYDCQSISANLNFANILSNILSKRRNITTGASAASSIDRNNSESSDQETDNGDGQSNELVLSCPYFRNELGGEEERLISLNRKTSENPAIQSPAVSKTCLYLHRPNMASGLTLLENANEARWMIKVCPYQKLSSDKCFTIENCDIGAAYYRIHFFGLEHQNWFGIDDNLGPIAISIRKERIHSSGSLSCESDSHEKSGPTSLTQTQIKHQYRLIIRTSELTVLRGIVFEDCVPVLASNRHSHHNNHHAKEVLEYIAPELTLSNLRLGVSSADEQLLKLDEQVLIRTYKVGILYCKNCQGTEEEMYNNEHSTPAFDEFLNCLGEKVRLKGFEKYRAGLDNKSDTTGKHSVYTTYHDCEIMFHVSTMLPYSPNNRQQLLRKRHIGNDIVTIIFQEPNALPFTPRSMRSQFQHVFIIVRLLPSTYINGKKVTSYAVAVSRSKEVPIFGPPIPDSGIFVKSKAFTEFLLSKIINGENAAHRSAKFRSMAQRTRYGYLKDLATNSSTSTTLNDVSCGNSASAKIVSTIFGSSRRSRASRVSRDWQFIGNSEIKGAIVWSMSVDDFGQSILVDCLVGISSDTLIVIEESTKQIIFACPNHSILGWTSHPSFIKIFYHQGECIVLKCKDPDLDEIAEIVIRLKAVTNGVETQELILKRNSFGHLGFHVGHDGIVTDVEEHAFAWKAGLRKNCRIVEICKVAIATLNYEQMVDLLKTSVTVTVTIIVANHDGSPKR